MPDENLNEENQQQEKKLGGKRPGAGRKKGSRNRATIAAKRSLSELAQEHTATALETLVYVAQSGESDSARVAAAVAILDRGYGRPVQSVESTGKDGGPIEINTNVSDIEVARRIAFVLARATQEEPES